MAKNILGSLILNLVTKADTTGLNKTDRAIQKTTKTLKTMSKETSVIGKLSGKLFGGLSFTSVKDWFMGYLEFEKQLGSIHSRFYAITKDSDKATKQFEFARKIAKETATDINSVVDSYSIFYSSAQRALGEGGAQEVYSNWTKVARVLHLSGSQYERVMYALREMSSKGQLYAQDLMIQMGTHVPDIRNVAEEAIKRLDIKGVTSIKDFQEYTKKNTGTDAMARFLVEFSKEAKGRFASDEALKKALQQPDALMQTIANTLYEMKLAFSQSGGAYMVVKILMGITEAIKTIPFEDITKFLGKVARAVGDIASYITTHIPQILSILKLILISLAIYTGSKFLISMFKGIWSFFDIFKGVGKTAPFLMKTLYSLGLAFPKLAKFAQFFMFGGLKTVLGGVLGLSGPLGWIVGFLTFLPEISALCKWISKKLGVGENTSFLGSLSSKTGYSEDQLKYILGKVSQSGDMSAIDLINTLNKEGFSKLTTYVGLDTNNTINVYLPDGTKLGLAEAIKSDTKTEVKPKSSYSNKPVTTNAWEAYGVVK